MGDNLLLSLLCGIAALHALVAIDQWFGESGHCSGLVNGVEKHLLSFFFYSSIVDTHVNEVTNQIVSIYKSYHLRTNL